MSGDPLARRLAASALACALVALVLAGYAVSLQQERRDELRALTESLQRAVHLDRAAEMPLRAPPPMLDDEEQ